jgi:branched-chain amino acid aminotransferase
MAFTEGMAHHDPTHKLLNEASHIWMNGEFVEWENATIHILSHAVHYGSSIFEGIRAYNTAKGTAIFKLPEHTKRFFNSTKIYRMKIPYTQEEISNAIVETIKINKLKSCYIRPIAYRGYHSLGVDPSGCSLDVAIAVWEWGKYLGPEALEKGVAVRVSSWNRIAPNTMPATSKAGANYMNSQLIKMEALIDGYVEGIALDINGFVSEGSAENIFLVMDGKIITPPQGASILPGITRDSIITLAKEEGFEVKEQFIPREFLYIADEVFFTGTAAEVSPISSVDKIPVGNGKRGPITEILQRKFLDIVENGNDPHGWLMYI